MTPLGLWRFAVRKRNQRMLFLNVARHFEHNKKLVVPSLWREVEVSLFLLLQQGKRRMRIMTSRPCFETLNFPSWSMLAVGWDFHSLARHRYHRAPAWVTMVTNIGQKNPWSQQHPSSKSTLIGMSATSLAWICRAVGFVKGISKRWGIEDEILQFVIDPAEVALRSITKTYPEGLSW